MAKISDSSAKSPSSCSSPFPFLALSPIPTSSGASRNYSMEEVWRNISLSSLRHHPFNGTAATVTSATTSGPALQDYLIHDISGSPPNEKQPKTGTGKSLLVPSVLSLNARVEIPLISAQTEKISCPLPGLDALNYSSGAVEFSTLGKKRVLESDESGGDPRNQRMMKNRESAARSRARKQAYTTQLELEVSRLTEENGRLRGQLEKLLSAAASAHCPKKNKLHRTSTAPF